MKTYKPDLNEKLTIRVSVATKAALRALCSRNDLDESLITRIALEAGMVLAKEQGITALMEARDKGIKAALPSASATPTKNSTKPYVIQKGTGASWSLVDPDGNTIKKGPLYSVRPHARKVAPEGSRIEIVHPDGKVERLS